MKKYLILFAILILLCASASATLIGSEDFENYTAQPAGVNNTFNNSLFLSESGNRWHCSNPTYTPYCARPVNSAVAIGALGNFTVFSYLGNQWMRIWAVGGDATNYYSTGLQWNYSSLPHEDVLANTVWTKSFRIRLVYCNWGSLTGTSMRAGYGGEEGSMGYSGNWCGTPTCEVEFRMGGIYTSTENNYTSLRGYLTSTLPEMRPFNGYDMSDTNWHYVTEYYYINSSCDETHVEQYIDGVLFENLTINHNFACLDTWATNFLEFNANKIFAFDIDDLAVYNTKEDLFVEPANVSDADTCDSYTLPYYLIETFNGYLSKCDWSSSYDYFYAGALQLYNSTGYFYIQKTFVSPSDGSTLTSTNSRYATLSFDLAVTNAQAGKNVAVRMYDANNQNIFVFWSDGYSYYYLNEGNTIWLANLSTSSYNWKFIFDLSTSKVDIYLNNVLLESQGNSALLNYNGNSLSTIKITSSNVSYTLDNIYIYTSDSIGTPFLGDITSNPIAQNETVMCGLFYRFTGGAPSCNADADCVTGDCMANGKCNSFDMTYCDEKGYTRGNKCILAAIASCTGQTVSDILLNNFLWVLVGIVILMAIVYLSILLRRR